MHSQFLCKSWKAQQAIISNKHSAVTSRSCQQSAAKKMFPHSHWLESSFKTWWLILIKESTGTNYIHISTWILSQLLNSNRSTIFLAPSRAQGATKSVCPTGTKCSILIFLSQVCLLALLAYFIKQTLPKILYFTVFQSVSKTSDNLSYGSYLNKWSFTIFTVFSPLSENIPLKLQSVHQLPELYLLRNPFRLGIERILQYDLLNK